MTDITTSSGPWTADRFSQLREKHWPAIQAELEAVVPRRDGITLEAMTWYHFETGGKRLRALVPVAVAEALGTPASDAYAIGGAIEMLHNATLVHDDLQDGDTLRRGRPTLWTKYNAAQAINTGDAMFYYTIQLVHRTPRRPEVLVKLADRVLAHTLDVIGGQVAEFRVKESDTPSVEDYLEIVRGKTSGLFALPLLAGALVAEAPAALTEALVAIGEPLGVLFQIQDDLLDVVGEKGRDRRGSDIAEGKISYLAAHALENAPEPLRAEFDTILRTPRDETSTEAIERAIAILEEVGSLRSSVDKLKALQAEVVTKSQSIDPPALRDLVRGLTNVFLAPVQDYLRAYTD